MDRGLAGIKRFNIFAPSRKILSKAKKIAEQIDALKKQYRALSHEELTNKTTEFVARLQKGVSLDSLIVEAFATVREAVYRVHKLFAFKVQLIAAVVLHYGDFAELYTGEGKTLVCVIAAYLNALTKKGVHVITVNEYLTQRDAKFCAECLNPLGITVGYNLSSFDQEQKRKMFACDITYTTNSELGFDYLRDNMVRNYEDKVIRTLNYAIVDEGDSVLIDEARTPLIISGQPKRDVSLYVDVDRFVKTLKPEDYKKDPESNTASLTDSGVKKAEEFFKVKNLYSVENSNIVHKIKNSLMANYIFQHGVQYVVQKDQILLVDQFTGRILEGRSYNAGLQQAIQAKEYVKIEPENITVATVTYQSFFRLYKKLSACSGTALTEEEEFMRIYNMVVVPVPTNKPNKRVDHPDYIFANKNSKWHHVLAEVERVHKTGQPILIGTGSVEDSETLANLMSNKGLVYEVLNAKNNAKEAEIVKNAGKKGAITISTNMAGRGTDIKLDDEVKSLGGLYVIGTEKNESRRIDNQLRGRSGRQGDIGQTRFFISLQDDIFRRFATDLIDKADQKINNDRYDSWFFNKMLATAQKKIESLNFDARKHLIDYDSVLASQRELVYKQRDEILVANENFEMLKNMAKTTAKELVSLNLSEKNKIYVDELKIAAVLNKAIFSADIINPIYFKNKEANEATAIISEIIKMSIDIRVGELNQDQIQKILKDVILQNLDFQWTNHLDRIMKLREGVMLRSLEQRSPLNIYVEEADANFNEMKLAIARNSVVSFHRMYIPGILGKITKVLSEAIPGILKDSVLMENAENSNKTIEKLLNAQPNIKINLLDNLPKANPQTAPASNEEKAPENSNN